MTNDDTMWKIKNVNTKVHEICVNHLSASVFDIAWTELTKKVNRSRISSLIYARWDMEEIK